MKILDPYIGAIKALVIVLLAIGLFGAGHHFGAQGVQAKWEAEKAESVEMTLATERETRRAVDVITLNSRKEKESAKTTIDSLRSDVRSGAQRLSVAVGSCPAADPRAGHPEARAELLPAAADRIVGIIGEADDAVLDLNECIAKYDAVKQKLERSP